MRGEQLLLQKQNNKLNLPDTDLRGPSSASDHPTTSTLTGPDVRIDSIGGGELFRDKEKGDDDDDDDDDGKLYLAIITITIHIILILLIYFPICLHCYRGNPRIRRRFHRRAIQGYAAASTDTTISPYQGS